ncbi:MAG: YraN family protein [Proteobacteria bacterium]|nr:YraN family protein [Pseudomonadota bacterium]
MAAYNSHQRGRLAEEKAFSFLKKNGLKPLERNYTTTRGEIDIIMQDGETIVFIEVRARTQNNIVDALETIDRRKCSNIIYASEHYLQKHKKTNRSICRFDIIILAGPLKIAKIEWIKNAFEA